MGSRDVADPPPAAPRRPRRGVVLATVTVFTALYAMSVTAVNVSLPQIQGALSATQDQIAWVVTFNLVASAVATPTAGWLGARLGYRNVMVWGTLGFTLATLLCGLAGGLAELVVYRVLQGAVGAPLVPIAQAIILEIYPRERHGFATTVWGMGVVLGPLFAPTVGGYLSEALSWRWVFFMMLPICAVCLLGTLLFIHDRAGAPATRPRLDWTGFIALSATVACFQLMLDRGERNDWFDSPEILIEAAIALGAFYVFLVHSLTARAPFLSPQTFRDRNFTVGILITLVFGMVFYTPMVLFPTMLQELQGYPDSVIGLLLGARSVGTMVGFVIMLFAGHLDPRLWLLLGFGAQAAAGFRTAQFHLEVPMWDVALVSALQGLGTGLLWVPLTLVTFATLDPARRAEGTAVFHLLRNIGSSIHISLSVAIVVHTSKINYAELTALVTPYSQLLGYRAATGAWSVDTPGGLLALSGEMSRQAAMLGYVNAFFAYGLTCLLVLPLVLLVRRPRP